MTAPQSARQLFFSLCAALLVLSVLPVQASDAGAGTKLGDDGLHKQAWFHESFLDLKENLEEAKAAGKGLIVAFEQAGCPYCREMHRVNFADKEITSYLRKDFLFVQLDLRGSREVTDFDGKAMEERKLGRRWGIVFTPTFLLFAPGQKVGDGKLGQGSRISGHAGVFQALPLPHNA